MNLLPKPHQNFSDKEYWNLFFTNRGKKAFEWYGEYAELCELLHKYIKQKDDILVIGCGNSNLSADLHDVGYRNLTNIDISKVVIKQMQKQRPDIKYMHMDALNMSFENETFSVVLDKGTVDALMPDDSVQTLEQTEKLFVEINRVTRTGGRFICISLLQEHILKHLLNYFPKSNWMFRVVRCYDAERKSAENSGSVRPVFAVVCTKFKNLPTMILETSLTGDKLQRLESTEELILSVKALQEIALVCSGLQKSNIGNQDEVSFDLFEPGKNSVRFSVYIVDQQPAERKNKQYAAFIVPQGRETEWLFSTKAGRRKLLKTAQFNRLAIVTLHRGQDYHNLESVKEELNHSVQSFAPANVTDRIPFLSLGDDVGKREVRCEGISELSGPFVVEDFTGTNGQTYRRLIFLNNQNIVQSEAKLRIVRVRGGKYKTVVDPLFLACQHHAFMSVGTQLACSCSKEKTKEVAVIGLGGGGLCTFLHNCIPNTCISAVDIDATVLKVATDWFGLLQNDKLKIYIEDGLKFLQQATLNNTKYDAVLFDVDNKDTSLGISCPPKFFLELDVLENVKNCIRDEGVFIINLVLRDETLRKPILEKLKSKFKTIASYKLQEDLNEILFCKKTDSHENLLEDIKSAATVLNNIVKKKRKQYEGDLIDVVDMLETLTMYE